MNNLLLGIKISEDKVYLTNLSISLSREKMLTFTVKIWKKSLNDL